MCTSPKIRWIIGQKWNDEKQKYQDIIRITDKMNGPNMVFETDTGKIAKKEEIPCGKCTECQLKKAQEWANRIMLECQNAPGKNYMITLTYNNENLPMTTGIIPETGEVTNVPTLKKKDLQDFNKRLKRHWEYNYGTGKEIRYFAAGEYGDQYKRPHYHVIYFNIDINDIEDDHVNKKGFMQLKSKEIEELWGKGLTTIEPVNYEVAEYVSRYLLKKQHGTQAQEYYKDIGKIPEFNMMSLKPGIGYNYLAKKGEELYETQKIWIPTKKKIKEAHPPRYFDKKLEQSNPELYEKVKAARIELAKLKESVIRQQTGLSMKEYLSNKNEKISKKIKQLNRPYENA